MFLLYINDISESILSSLLRLFADDCIVCRVINSKDVAVYPFVNFWAGPLDKSA